MEVNNSANPSLWDLAIKFMVKIIWSLLPNTGPITQVIGIADVFAT